MQVRTSMLVVGDWMRPPPALHLPEADRGAARWGRAGDRGETAGPEGGRLLGSPGGAVPGLDKGLTGVVLASPRAGRPVVAHRGTGGGRGARHPVELRVLVPGRRGRWRLGRPGRARPPLDDRCLVGVVAEAAD